MNISPIRALSIINRVYIFPVCITIAILLLIGDAIFSFANDTLSVLYGSLFLVFLSGIFTTCHEGQEETYFTQIKSSFRTRIYLVASFSVSIITVLVIWNLSMKMGFLSIPVSILSGLLIATTSLSLLEDR